MTTVVLIIWASQGLCDSNLSLQNLVMCIAEWTRVHIIADGMISRMSAFTYIYLYFIHAKQIRTEHYDCWLLFCLLKTKVYWTWPFFRSSRGQYAHSNDRSVIFINLANMEKLPLFLDINVTLISITSSIYWH